MKKFLNLLKWSAGIYLAGCFFIFIAQEKFLFHPKKDSDQHTYNFSNTFSEVWIEQADGILTHALHFTVPNPKGIIFYLHGNAGSLSSWGNEAMQYVNLGYDVFMPDYRGFGKSKGNINSQQQLFDDNQTFYNWIKNKYEEKKITVMGYSLGTAIAARIASDNSPRQLVLHAPYYNMKTLSLEKTKIFPGFLVKYPFTTNKYLQNCDLPIHIFHGKEDRVIPFSHTEKLQKESKTVHTYPLLNQGHNGISQHPDYLNIIKERVL
ncbi:alpha/beta hydrolase [Lishizhenia sp.]|uniref:alpha/beta hydrolase n=1 Tax=Lishizhenia sp. TaxID=2497594 RepID=UPI00299E97B2|nr:alpha/beta fold hydrolase [Lishizhenia sp.]MDX1446667.1 alpha/beta fold hydrolase [Lishizhenia sp.]